MVNTDDFIKRLEIILDYYSLNASTFADKIGVQRSSLSHLLSGRNKPSLDFILKIIEVFPDVDLYWILNGEGVFPKNYDSVENTKADNSSTIIPGATTPIDLFSPILSSIENEYVKEKNNSKKINSHENNTIEEIEKIIFFYKNGTFKIYTP
jgi:DNA-binding XRE family transcriptional regulator